MGSLVPFEIHIVFAVISKGDLIFSVRLPNPAGIEIQVLISFLDMDIQQAEKEALGDISVFIEF